MARSNIDDRLQDYKSAFKKWLDDAAVRHIVVVENSGFDLSEFRYMADKARLRKEVEFISFDGQDFPRHLGKGFGENIALKEVVRSSKLLASSKKFIKLNGRYYVNNSKTFFDEMLRPIDVYCDLSRNLSWSDSRLFGGSLEFLRNYVCTECSRINDSAGVFFEHCLARASLRALADGYTWKMPNTIPDIVGLSGTTNAPYSDYPAKRVARMIFRRIKSRIFAR